jgi:hypothetical protein
MGRWCTALQGEPGMILSKAEYLNATQLIESKPEPPKKGSPFPAQIKRRILNSTVKLTGGLLNGSGVIFNVKYDSVSIVSAAHNIQAFKGANQPRPNNWRTLLDGQNGFIAKVKIWFGKDDLSFDSTAAGQANIDSAAVPATPGTCNNRQNCLYDLMVITSKDDKLLKYAVEKVFGGTWYDDVNKLKAEIDKINQAVKAEATVVKDKPTSLLVKKKYYFVQLGFGEIGDKRTEYLVYTAPTDPAKGKIRKKTPLNKAECAGEVTVHRLNLQYRLTAPLNLKIQSMFNHDGGEEVGQLATFEENASGISIVGNRSSSSAPGDSGGPLYAVDKNFAAVYLIGVTCGADLKPSAKVCKPYTNCVSTSVAPYWKDKFNSEFP